MVVMVLMVFASGFFMTARLVQPAAFVNRQKQIASTDRVSLSSALICSGDTRTTLCRILSLSALLQTLYLPKGPFDGDVDIFAAVVSAIETEGYIVLDDFLPASLLENLYQAYITTEDHEFTPAGVGRQTDFQVNRFLRRDEICWLDTGNPLLAGYFDWIETLRLRINEGLFLGLFDYECHFANYAEGAFYRKHLDAFKSTNTGGVDKSHSNRRLSTVLYLNQHWNSADGGELAMYQSDASLPFITIEPVFGRMVIFLSEVFPHEVLMVNKPRYSLTGWYRINGNTGEILDPPV